MIVPTPPPGFSLGLDVSQFQGAIHAPDLIAADVSFLYARATYGGRYVDPEWDATADSCRVAGLAFGGYGVLVPGSGTAVEQADAFCASLESARGWSLPPALDFELARGWSAAQAFASAAEWLLRVEQRLGCRAIVYTGPSFWMGLRALSAGNPAAHADILAIVQRPLWLADYLDGHPIDPTTRAPRVPLGWDVATVWQVGPAGATLPTGRAVDVNWLRGPVSELEALAEPERANPAAQTGP